MKKQITLILILVGLSIVAGCETGPKQSQIVGLLNPADVFPEIQIQAPEQTQDMSYLGINDQQTFTIKDVQADVIVMEIMNTHCFSCKKQAKAYNKLYQLIENDIEAKGRIKIFSIAVGNNADETREFRDKYKIHFPLIPDPSFQVQRNIEVKSTPYSFYIRKDPFNKVSRIIDTHLGANIHYQQLFNRLSAMVSEDYSVSLSEESMSEPRKVGIEPVLSENEMASRVKKVFQSLGGELHRFDKIPMQQGRHIYVGELEKQGGINKLFAEALGRAVPCDVCHDAHFIYVFDTTGKVVHFEPIQLTKYDNEVWDENDLLKIRSGIIGKYIFRPLNFDPKIDAISSATITTAVIYNSFADGHNLYRMLKEKEIHP